MSGFELLYELHHNWMHCNPSLLHSLHSSIISDQTSFMIFKPSIVYESTQSNKLIKHAPNCWNLSYKGFMRWLSCNNFLDCVVGDQENVTWFIKKIRFSSFPFNIPRDRRRRRRRTQWRKFYYDENIKY